MQPWENIKFLSTLLLNDHAKDAALAAGFEELFWKIRQKPGKPLFVCRLKDTLLLGLPGNPVSAFMCFINYVRPVLAELQGVESIHHSIPVPGLVTMVDLGAKKCIPCKMMALILAELEKKYEDRAAIVFIDVWENPNAGKEFGISTIPTQIFYDDNGKEVLRHVGFYDKAGIVAELQKLGTIE